MTPTSPEVDTDVRTRMPFSLSEQLKILLIFVDGLPFRSTKEGYPNRLDVGEASDLCGWSEPHLHLLVHRALELDLIRETGDRFYMTERVDDWELDRTDDSLGSSRIPGYWTLDDAPTETVLRDDSLVVDSLSSLLKILEQEQGGTSVSTLVGNLRSEPAPSELLDEDGVDSESFGEDMIRMARDLGFVDVIETDETFERIELNARGRSLLTNGGRTETVTEENQELPMILQPDGRLMLPLESPLEDFRRIHPFVLLTGIDNMIEYNIDGRSLVKAENEGWNTRAFYQFLKDRNGSVPETVGSLFQESEADAEEVRIEDVYHLLHFENGSTAAEAMRVLSNYQPERVDEDKIILRSSSSAETIKKNLSRAGIRIQMATGPAKDASPVQSVPEEATDEE